MTVQFELDGQPFVALNGGQEVECGWLKDRYGVSWQVVPADIEEMLQDKDPEKPKRVLAAVMKMKKLDMALLRKAYEGR